MAPEIECIKVEKVYDFCCEEEDLFLCFEVKGVQPGDIVSECELIVDECKPIGCAPIPSRPGFAEVTFRKRIRIRIRVRVDNCVETSESLILEKKVILCVPADPSDPGKCDPRIQLQCETTGVCGPCVVTACETVCCAVRLCECFESKANVKLKVPSYGFCVPRFCEVPPPPPPPCPPPFPPQCVQSEEIDITFIDTPVTAPIDSLSGSEVAVSQEPVVNRKTIRGPAGGAVARVDIFQCDSRGNCRLAQTLRIQQPSTVINWLRIVGPGGRLEPGSTCRAVVTALSGTIKVFAISQTGHLKIKNGANQAIVESDTFRCPNQPPFDP